MTAAEVDRLREAIEDVSERLDREVPSIDNPRVRAAVRTQCAKLRAALSWLPDVTQVIKLRDDPG